jgi:hypothetical protein
MSAIRHSELVPPNVSEADLRDEVNRRTARAGYTTRNGEMPYATRVQGLCNWGRQKLNVWPRDKHGNLIP